MVSSAGTATRCNCPIRTICNGRTSGAHGYGFIAPNGTATSFGACALARAAGMGASIPPSQSMNGFLTPSGSGSPGPSSVLPASIETPMQAVQVRCCLPFGVYFASTVTADMST
jgi:hypothetical protein